MRVKMSKQPPPAPTASAVDPCPTVIKIVGRPSTGSLPSTFAPPDHPHRFEKIQHVLGMNFKQHMTFNSRGTWHTLPCTSLIISEVTPQICYHINYGLVGCIGFSGPLRQYCSLYGAFKSWPPFRSTLSLTTVMN